MAPIPHGIMFKKIRHGIWRCYDWPSFICNENNPNGDATVDHDDPRLLDAVMRA